MGKEKEKEDPKKTPSAPKDKEAQSKKTSKKAEDAHPEDPQGEMGDEEGTPLVSKTSKKSRHLSAPPIPSTPVLGKRKGDSELELTAPAAKQAKYPVCLKGVPPNGVLSTSEAEGGVLWELSWRPAGVPPAPEGETEAEIRALIEKLPFRLLHRMVELKKASYLHRPTLAEKRKARKLARASQTPALPEVVEEEVPALAESSSAPSQKEQDAQAKAKASRKAVKKAKKAAAKAKAQKAASPDPKGKGKADPDSDTSDEEGSANMEDDK